MRIWNLGYSAPRPQWASVILRALRSEFELCSRGLQLSRNLRGGRKGVYNKGNSLKPGSHCLDIIQTIICVFEQEPPWNPCFECSNTRRKLGTRHSIHGYCGDSCLQTVVCTMNAQCDPGPAAHTSYKDMMAEWCADGPQACSKHVCLIHAKNMSADSFYMPTFDRTLVQDTNTRTETRVQRRGICIGSPVAPVLCDISFGGVWQRDQRSGYSGNGRLENLQLAMWTIFWW